MESPKLKFNPLDEKKEMKKDTLQGQTVDKGQAIDEDNKDGYNKLLKPKKERGAVLRLFKDLWTYIWDENDKGDKIKKDISKIEIERNKKKLSIAKKQQRLEAKAKKRAYIKAKQAHNKLIKEQARKDKEQAKKDKEEIKHSIKDKKIKPVLFKTKDDERIEIANQLDKDKSMKELAQNKFEQAKPGNNGLLNHQDLSKSGFSSALNAGILRKKSNNEINKFGFQADKKLKKESFWSKLSKLFGFKSKTHKTIKMSNPNDRQDENFGLSKISKLDNNDQVKSGISKKTDRISPIKIKDNTKHNTKHNFNNINVSSSEKNNSELEFKSKIELPKQEISPKQKISPKHETSIKHEISKISSKSSDSVDNKPIDLDEFSKHKQKMADRLSAEREKYANLKIREDIENRFWHSHDIVRANLIKDQETLFFNWRSKVLTLILAIGLACLTIGVLYGALLVWESNKLDDNRSVFDNIENTNKEISKAEAATNEILDFNDKLVLVDFILDNHIYWTNFFKFLEEYTVFDVYYEGFSGDIGGQYSIPSVARDFRSIYLQIKLMQQYNNIMSANTESAKQLQEQIKFNNKGEISNNTIEEKIKFVLDLIVDRKIFLR